MCYLVLTACNRVRKRYDACRLSRLPASHRVPSFFGVTGSAQGHQETQLTALSLLNLSSAFDTVNWDYLVSVLLSVETSSSYWFHVGLGQSRG